jgi:hypothetical protein
LELSEIAAERIRADSLELCETLFYEVMGGSRGGHEGRKALALSG